MQARYADGRIPVFVDGVCEFREEALTLRVGEAIHTWAYADLRRVDDGNGRIVLKRKTDTGERLSFEADAKTALKSAAPRLFTARAQGVESPTVVACLAVAAWSVAGLFLVGVPMAAGPIANAMPPAYREQMADISWSQVNAVTQYCDDSDEAAAVLNDLAYRIMNAANVAQREAIWITIVEADFPNAFALPDESIIVTDDLIAMAESPDELVGVLAHEIAHIERNHVMKGVIRQIGAGFFFDVVVGGAGVGQAVAIASVNLTALRYTRGDEAEADARGLDMLDSAGIDPGPLARLFDRVDAMAAEQGLDDIPTILSSHPNSADRAAAARARARPGSAPSLNDAEWAIVRGACGGGELEDEQETPEAAPPSAD